MRAESEQVESRSSGADQAEALCRVRDLFEDHGRRFAPDDPRRVGFTRFSRRSLHATVSACLRFSRQRMSGAERLLDLGCGSGLFLPLLRETFPVARVHGVDIVEANVEAAIERGYDGVRCFDISTVGQRMDPGSFDLVLCVEAIQYLSPVDRARLATGVARVLAPDGLFVLVYPNPESWLRRLRPLGPDHDPFPYDTRKLLEIAERVDFRVQRFFGAGLLTAGGMQGDGLDPRLSALAFRLGVVLAQGRRRPEDGSR